MTLDSGGENRGHSIMAGALHYANLVALVGIAFIFLTVFVSGGTLQLAKMPTSFDSYYYEDLHGQSVWDYIWNQVDQEAAYEGVVINRPSGLIASFTLALVVAVICLGVSRKMQKDGSTAVLAGVSVGLCGIGAGILHSYASILFVIPAVMAIPLLMAPIFRGMGGPRSMVSHVGWSAPAAGGQYPAAHHAQAQSQPQPQAQVQPQQVAADTAGPAGASGDAAARACPSCGSQNTQDAAFCGYCGAKFE